MRIDDTKFLYLRKRLAILILLLVFFSCGDLLLPSEAAPAEHIVHLTSDSDHYFLGPYLFYLEDSDNKLSIEDVSSPHIYRQFSRNMSKPLSLGIDSSVYWIRFSVDAKGVQNSHQKWLLYFNWPNPIAYATLYIPASTDTGWLIKEVGRILPTGYDPLPSTPSTFLPTAGFTQPVTFYLRVESSYYKRIFLQILTDEVYDRTSRRRSLWFGVYFGILLAMIIYNLVWAVSLRELYRLYYLLYLIFFGLMFLAFNGLLLEFFHLGFHLNQVLIYTFICVLFFWGSLFVKSFLITKKHAPLYDKLLSICMVLALILILMIPFISLSRLMFAVFIQILFFPPIFLNAGITVWRRGFRPARFFLIAFTILALSSIYEALVFFNVLPFFNQYSSQFASAIEVILLQLALADRFRTLSYEQDKIKQSLYLAREVQQNLLPHEDPKVDKLDIAGQSIYCDETGGDYYDFILSDKDEHEQIGIAIGDVSGHGVSSALLMSAVRSSLRQRLYLPGNLSDIISDVNRQLVQDVEDSGQFVTMFYLTIDPIKKHLEYVRAGHDPAIVYDPNTDAFEELGGTGMALGVDENWKAKAYNVALNNGQLIFLSTDGIWEARNLQGEMFGKESICDIIRNYSSLSAKEILNTILESLNNFQKGAKNEDDITLVIIKIIE